MLVSAPLRSSDGLRSIDLCIGQCTLPDTLEIAAKANLHSRFSTRSWHIHRFEIVAIDVRHEIDGGLRTSQKGRQHSSHLFPRRHLVQAAVVATQMSLRTLRNATKVTYCSIVRPNAGKFPGASVLSKCKVSRDICRELHNLAGFCSGPPYELLESEALPPFRLQGGFFEPS